MTDAVPTPTSAVDTGWGWVLAAGIGMSIVAVFMLVFPGIASLAVTLFVGWSLILAGVLGILGGIFGRADGGRWKSIILGVLTMIAGIFLAFNLLAGTATLTMVFVLWLIIDGAVGTFMSIARRGRSWGWWLINSVITLTLGIVLLNAMPLASVAVLGVYAGLVLLLRGMLLTVLSLEIRRAGQAT